MKKKLQIKILQKKKKNIKKTKTKPSKKINCTIYIIGIVPK